MAHPERFERPTLWFVARYSIQLSYGCIKKDLNYKERAVYCQAFYLENLQTACKMHICY